MTKPTIINADCLDALRDLPDNSVHAVVTDPPYGLSNTDPEHVAEAITRWANGDREYMPTGKGFMNAAWDAFVPPVAVWDECLRVLKPGGHMLVFAGSRTQDLMGLSIRLAGFDIRDTIMWVYGNGFPRGQNMGRLTGDDTWSGWSTALKPANEPIIMARKPVEGSITGNVLAHGAGALNIDACRVPTDDNLQGVVTVGGMSLFHGFSTVERLREAAEQGGKCPDGRDARKTYERYLKRKGMLKGTPPGKGRYPANVILDEHAAEELDQQAGGNYAKYFYCAQASQKERPYIDGVAHPTVKPLKLMEYLVTLVTPPGGTILDPFAGSGTTIEAAINKEFNVIGIEREADYLPLIQARINRATNKED